MIPILSRSPLVGLILIGCNLWLVQGAEVLLRIEPESNFRLRLEWDASANVWLESAPALDGEWTRVFQVPVLVEGKARLLIVANKEALYFRLREATTTQGTETSASAGEPGAAVTREPILRLSAPLAGDTVPDLDPLHAQAVERWLHSTA